MNIPLRFSHCRSIILFAIPIVLAILLLVGMGRLFQKDTAQAASLASTDFSVGVYTDVISLDPAGAGWDLTSLLVVSQIYDTLTAYRSGGSLPEPALAITWSVSADGLTWTFDLHPGLTFHDGTSLDAEAVVFNFERWWDPANPYHQGDFIYFQSMFGGFKGDPNCFLDSVSAIGDTGVQLVLTSPHSTLPGILSMPSFAIASPAAIQAGTLPTDPVGSGTFRFAAHDPGASILLEANPDYWGGAPQPDTLTFQIIPDDAARFAALESGAIQAAGDLADEYALLAENDPQFQVTWRPSVWLGYLGMNTAHTPLDEPLVRQAIAHAIDLPAMIESQYSAGDQVADQLLPPAVWGGDPDLSVYSYDPALAISLLASAGYTDGFTTTISYRPVPRAYLPDPVAAANAFSAYLEAVGIHAVVTEYESSVFLQKVKNGELDLYMLGWGADYLHPDNFFSPLLCDPTNLGLGPVDETLCGLVASALEETDFEAQMALYQSASQRLHETLQMLPIVHPRNTLLLRYDVAGVQASPMGMEIYQDAHFVGAEQIIVDPETEGSLVYSDEQALTTTLELPAGAVSETLLLRYAMTETSSTPAGYASANHTFDLSAIDFGEVLPGFTFNTPVTLTIFYADSDVANRIEETLRLFTWDGTQWQDAASTCDPESGYAFDPELNRISLPICHLSTFGLFAEPQIRQYLPLVVRSSFVPSSGMLDPAFDGDGMLIADYSTEGEWGRSVALQADGKIMVAGNAKIADNDEAFLMARFHPDGTLDTSFGVDGWVVANVYESSDMIMDIALQEDGKIVAAGRMCNPAAGCDFGVARYNTDGSLDTTFDGDGWLTTDFAGGADYAYSLAIQPDGKLVVAGLAGIPYNDYDLALARYYPDGSLDTSFGNGGKVTTDYIAHGYDMAFAVTLQADGKIVAAGAFADAGVSHFGLARYNSDGSLDAGFGDNGLVLAELGASYGYAFDVLVQPDGKLVSAGWVNAPGGTTDFALARFNTDGSPDTSFASVGWVVTDLNGNDDFAQSVALQPDGRLLVAGYSDIAEEPSYNPESVFALARFNADGSLDTHFGTGGWLTTDLAGFDDECYAMSLLPDGRIVLAGESEASFALVKYK